MAIQSQRVLASTLVSRAGDSQNTHVNLWWFDLRRSRTWSLVLGFWSLNFVLCTLCFALSSLPFALCPLAHFFSHGEPVEALQIYFEADPGFLRRQNRALWSHGNRRVDDIFFPVASARRYITRQSKARLRGHRNVMSSSDARLEHSSAPNWDSVLATNLLNSGCFSMPAHTTELYVHNPG